MLPKSKEKLSRMSIQLMLAVIKRKLPANVTTWRTEKAGIPDAKRCKIQRDVKKSVDRVIYDNFSSLSNNQIYIELEDGFTVFGRLS